MHNAGVQRQMSRNGGGSAPAILCPEDGLMCRRISLLGADANRRCHRDKRFMTFGDLRQIVTVQLNACYMIIQGTFLYLGEVLVQQDN